MDFNKLTLKSQEAVAAAQELARRMGNPELYPEHLLLALLDQELPQQLVPDAAALRAQAEATLRGKPSIQGAQQQPNVSAAFSRVLDKAADEARDPGAVAANEEQPGADRRPGRRQDSDRRRPRAADRRRRRTGGTEGEARLGARHRRVDRRVEVPRRVRGAAEGRPQRDQGR